MKRLLTPPPARAVLSLVALAALILSLHSLSRLGLRGPTGPSRAELSAWFDDPIVAVATILRWMALVMSYYLAAVLLAIVATRNQLDDTPLRFAVPARFATAVGLFIGFGAVAVPLTAHMASPSQPIESAAVDDLRLTRLDDSLTLERVHPGLPPDRPVPETGGPAERRTSRLDVDDSWTVAPGDSFWAIADEHLQDTWERDVTEAEVATYWKVLIDANVDRLVEPGNPDLLYPGQVLTLPEVPPHRR